MSFRKQGIQEKLAMIRLREEMQTDKPTMLNCSKNAHIFELFSFNIWIWVGHCEELIRGLKKIDGKSTN
jgi:hypothetical protein